MSSHQAQIDYKEVQQTFLIEHANDKLEDGRAQKIHSPEHHRAHLEGMSVRERQVARSYTKHLQ